MPFLAVWRILCALVALLLATAARADDIAFPPLTGFVVDNAAMLSTPKSEAIAATLRAYKARTGNHIVVVTVPDLQGQPIADFSNQLFRHWKLGTKTQNNGVLFLVARAEHDMRIEVGYGLEPVLTDATSHLILARDVKPAFKQGRFDDGIAAGVDDIIATLTPPANTPGQALAATRPVAPPDTVDPADQRRFLYHMLTIWGAIVGGILFLGFRARRLKKGRRGHAGSDGGSSDSSSGSSSSDDSSSGDGGSSGGGGASDSW